MRYEEYKVDGYIKVWLDDPKDAKKLMGVRKRKQDDFWVIEKNLVNAIALDDLSIVKIPQTVMEVEPPKGLFDYQVPDVVKMVQTYRILNNNRMGYGKTIETVCALRCARVHRGIVVAPKPILVQWESQFDVWWRDHPKIAINPKEPIDGINIYNYEQIVPEKKQVLLRSRIWDFVVVDESHRIKNPNAKRTKACTNIPAKYRIALTGTPILKTPDDLYSQLYFLDPRYCGKSYWSFRNYFCRVVTGFFGEEVKGLTQDDFRISVMNKLLDMVSIRNPDMKLTLGKTESIVKLGMDPAQRKLYKDAKTLLLDELPKDMTIPNGAVLTLRLRQITSSPSIFLKNVVGTKFEWIKETLEDNPGKIVVFTTFAKAAHNLSEYLNKNNIGCVEYTGEYDSVARAENKHKFINDKNIRVIVGTIACMGEGVDGLQNVSSTVVFLDRAWSPELNKQCEDRVNRVGQRNHVMCYYLECRNTFDRHVGRVNSTRAEDIRRALNDEDSNA